MTYQNTVRLTDVLSMTDYLVIISSLILTGAFARWGRSKFKHDGSAAGFIIMGRQLTLPMFVATLVSTWYGGIFGVTAIAFEQGIYNFFTQGLFWYATYIIFALFVVPRLRKDDAITLPQMVRHRFGERAAKLASIFNVMNVLPIAYVLSLGIFIRALTGQELLVSIFIGALFVLLYVGTGGLGGVVYSEIFQFLVMYVSVGSVAVFSFFTFGGLTYLKTSLPAHYFAPSGSESLLSMFVWGFIALTTLVDPNFYQRCFAAKTSQTAKIGILISTLFWCVFDIFTTMGGMYAAAIIPHAQPSDAYLSYAMQLLPSFWRGLLVAGIIATILSTIDSFTFVATNTISYDLLKRTDFGNKRKNFLILLATITVTALIATQFEGSIKKTWKVFGSYSAGCILIPLMLSLFTKFKIRERTFILSSVLACLTITCWFLIPRHGVWSQVEPIYPGILVSLMMILLGRLLDDSLERKL